MDTKSSAAFLATACLILALASGCATRHPVASPPVAPVAAPPSASIVPGTAIALDQYRLRLPFVLLVSNPGLERVWVDSLEVTLTVQGSAAGRLGIRDRTAVEGGSSATIPLELPIDLRNLDEGLSGSAGPSTAAWRLEARAGLSTAGGTSLALAAGAEGSFPIVRAPLFSLKSIRIERDLLVTTNLRLALEIDNPNDFPLVFDRLSYDFYGEGKSWAAGEADDRIEIPARGSMERGLRFTMNFADMDRRLFDLVAKLRIVRYRIAGEARIETGLDYLPAFVARFDREGSCGVER